MSIIPVVAVVAVAVVEPICVDVLGLVVVGVGGVVEGHGLETFSALHDKLQ